MDLRLYGVIGTGYTGGRDLVQAVEDSIAGGVTIVQLREKELGGREFIEAARRLREVTARSGVPLIINDRVDVALAVGADGVHLGQEDLPASAARRLVGRLILGISVSTPEEARQAQQDGADYLGIGPAFPTLSKGDAGQAISPAGVRAITEVVKVPAVAIGGIGPGNIDQLAGTGLAGVAVISAIYGQPDIRRAAEALKERVAHWS